MSAHLQADWRGPRNAAARPNLRRDTVKGRTGFDVWILFTRDVEVVSSPLCASFSQTAHCPPKAKSLLTGPSAYRALLSTKQLARRYSSEHPPR